MNRHPYRIISPWGYSKELPDLDTALAALDNPATSDYLLESWVDGAWVRIDL